MSRTSLPLHVGDISAFARSLGGQLAGLGRIPGHVELLNMLARAGGHKNYQHLRAVAAQDVPPREPEPRPIVDEARLRRLARLFDEQGRLLRWPPRRGMEESCLWAVWARVPARRVLSESELTPVLEAAHCFGDHALLRRGLCDYGLMTRTADGREYRRVEHRPTAEALALLERIGRTE